MTDRRQLALKMWEDHKHWTGEKKYALRIILKWLEEEKNEPLALSDNETHSRQRRGLSRGT